LPYDHKTFEHVMCKNFVLVLQNHPIGKFL
jgi:hypothetical protein